MFLSLRWRLRSLITATAEAEIAAAAENLAPQQTAIPGPPKPDPEDVALQYPPDDFDQSRGW